MMQVSEKERKLIIVTRYVNEEMITSFHNYDLTLTDFIRGSNNHDRGVTGGGFLNIPIKIYIPESKEGD